MKESHVNHVKTEAEMDWCIHNPQPAPIGVEKGLNECAVPASASASPAEAQIPQLWATVLWKTKYV